LSVDGSLENSFGPAGETVACLQCDLAVTVSDLAVGERANCPRCGFFLTSRTKDGLSRARARAKGARLGIVMGQFFTLLSHA
jgi:paraquat-inducible protein A